jgi:hypothetical protein
LRKTLNSRIIQSRHIRIKIIIIIVLKFNSGSIWGKAQVTDRVDPSQYKNKSSCYHGFKIWFGGRFGVRPGSRVGLTVDSGQCKDKNSYYHSFKTQLGDWLDVRPRCQEGQPGQHKIKVVIIIILELDSRVNSGEDPGQCINKSSYYHSFKTRFGIQSKTTFRSWVRRVNPADPNVFFLNNWSNLVLINFFIKKSTRFLSIFYLRLTCFLDWVRLN